MLILLPPFALPGLILSFASIAGSSRTSSHERLAAVFLIQGAGSDGTYCGLVMLKDATRAMGFLDV